MPITAQVQAGVGADTFGGLSIVIPGVGGTVISGGAGGGVGAGVGAGGGDGVEASTVASGGGAVVKVITSDHRLNIGAPSHTRGGGGAGLATSPWLTLTRQ